jgi:hypothetical protein
MPRLKFLSYLAISNIISFVLFLLINIGVPLMSFLDLLLVSLAFFSFYNVALYYISMAATKSKIKNQFIHLVLYNVFIKIIFAFVLIFVYVKATEPSSKFFIVPFVIVYFVFTIFETYFMSLMARK